MSQSAIGNGVWHLSGSARVSRAGFGVSPKQSFGKSAMARRHRQRARRARYPGACIFALLLSSVSFICRAQDATSSALSNSEAESAGIVVSATRIETPIKEIGSSVTLISSEEIERNQRRTLP